MEINAQIQHSTTVGNSFTVGHDTYCVLVEALRVLSQRWARRPAGRTAASRPSDSAGCWLAPVFGPRATLGIKTN